MGAELAFYHRSFYRRHGILRSIFGEVSLRGKLWFTPVKEAPLVRASRHAQSTANAPISVDEHDTLFCMIGCCYRTNVNAGGVLTLVAERGYKIFASARQSRVT